MPGSSGLRVGTGQCNVKAYNRRLRDLIAVGGAKPSFIVFPRLSLAGGPEAYRQFDSREDGWTQVVLRPASSGDEPWGWILVR